MKYNYFKKALRELQHQGRLLQFQGNLFSLDPYRIVNRALYGTEYDPDDVKLRNYMMMCQSYIAE